MKKINSNKFLGFLLNKNLLFLLTILIFWWSFLVNVGVGSSDVFHDRDQDGLTDEEEYMYGTDINNPDSDGDGYRDGVEVESGYDPLKPAPGDKILIQNNQTSEVLQKETKPNMTDDFFEHLESEKGSELDLLNSYYTNPESFQNNQEGVEALGDISLTSEDLQNLINQTTSGSMSSGEMELISEEEIKIKDKVTGSEKKKEKEEKEQIEKYLTQVFYIMSINKPFAIEEQILLPQLGAEYINQINGAMQLGQISQLIDLKEKSQKTYDEIIEIETPYITKDMHIRVLSIIKHLNETIDEEKMIDNQDPMTLALYVGELQAALIEGESLKSELESIVDEYEIEIFDSSNFEDLF